MGLVRMHCPISLGIVRAPFQPLLVVAASDSALDDAGSARHDHQNFRTRAMHICADEIRLLFIGVAMILPNIRTYLLRIYDYILTRREMYVQMDEERLMRLADQGKNDQWGDERRSL